jgi:metallopeptidase MepB
VCQDRSRDPANLPDPERYRNTRSVIEEIKKFINMLRKLTDDIVSKVKEQDATFEKVVLLIAYDENKQGLMAYILGFY